MMDDDSGEAPKGGGSFCIPRAAIKALMEGKADVATIGAYLILACHTDASGQYSTASVSALVRRMGLHKGKGGKAEWALTNLQSIWVKRGKNDVTPPPGVPA